MAASVNALTPFRVRSFRLQWPADLATSLAFEMEILVLAWYILVETKSVFLLSLYGALHFPGTLLAPLIGAFGDRIGFANQLALLRAVYTALAATLMGLAFAGWLSPAVVLIIAAVMGLVRPSDLGLRMALVSSIMPASQLVGALSVSRTTADSARVLGALTGAGLFAAVGLASTYVAIVIAYGIGFVLTLVARREGMRTSADASAEKASPAVAMTLVKRRSPLRELKEGLLHVWSEPRLAAAIWLAVLVNLTAFPFSHGLLPYVAKDVYGVGETGLGYLVASFAFGALIGAVGLSAARPFRPGPVMLVCAVIWYLFMLAFAQMSSPWAGGALLMLAGLAQSISLISLAALLLQSSQDSFRGRVMGVRILATNSLPLGLLISGALIGQIGFRVTVTLSILVGLALTGFIWLRWRKELWDDEGAAHPPRPST